MPKLHFYYAAMNAGKSTTLLQADFNYRERGMRTLLFTTNLDDRYGGTSSSVSPQSLSLYTNTHMSKHKYILMRMYRIIHNDNIDTFISKINQKINQKISPLYFSKRTTDPSALTLTKTQWVKLRPDSDAKQKHSHSIVRTIYYDISRENITKRKYPACSWTKLNF